MKKIAILGSTGSIGTQTLEIVRYNRDIQVTALAAGFAASRRAERATPSKYYPSGAPA